MAAADRWTRTRTLEKHVGPVHALAYSRTGAHVLSGGQDRAINLWSAEKGTLVASYVGHSSEVLGLVVSHDNAFIASGGGDRSVNYTDVRTATVVKRFSGHSGKVNAVALNAESTILASGSFDSTLRLWDLRSQQRLPLQILTDAKDSITSLYIKDAYIVAGSVDGTARTYDLRNGEFHADFFDQPVTSVALSADMQTLLASTLDSTVRLLDCTDGTLLQSFRGFSNTGYRIPSVWGHGEETVLAGDEDGRVVEWAVASGKILPSPALAEASGKTILSLAHHPTAKALVAGGADGKIAVFAGQS